MENLNIVLLIMAMVATAFGVLAILIPYLQKKGVNISGILSGTNTALDTADMVVDNLAGLFPDVAAFALIDRIIGWAQKAVEAAEQLYKTSQIDADKRKEEATKLVYQYLAGAGIEPDEQIKKIVEGSIEAAVFALPQTHDEGK